MDKLKLLVLFGGMSEEHFVSIKSARELKGCLDARKYETRYVYLSMDGAWRLVDGPDADFGGGRRAILSADRSAPGLWVEEAGGMRLVRVDAAFPMLHGKFGEDGAIQGLLDMSGIPYVGCGAASSALAMDKSLCYLAAAGAGVRTPEYRVVRAGEPAALGNLRTPVFVKPARSGSSFGVSRVEAADGLEAALREAAGYDDKLLIEEAVPGCEVGCALLDDGADLFAGEVDQIVLSGGFFRIHQEAKPETGSENASIRVPARIPDAARARVVETAKAVYRALGCQGLARVDLFYTPGGEVVLNEVNTMPGFTSYSRYPRMMAAAGMSLSEVADRLIGLALARGRAGKGAARGE